MFKRLLGLHELKDDAFYLGNPLLIGRRKIRAFEYIEGSVTDRFAGWRCRFSSREMYAY